MQSKSASLTRNRINGCSAERPIEQTLLVRETGLKHPFDNAISVPDLPSHYRLVRLQRTQVIVAQLFEPLPYPCIGP